MFAAFHDQPALALVSRSRDADLLCLLLSRSAVKVVRGSSSHGSVTTRALLRHLQAGGKVIMALDGPRGPALVEKSGSRWLGARGQAPLCRMEFRMRHSLCLPDWSRLRLPLPFGSVQVDCHLSFEPMVDSGNHTTTGAA
jgi:lysophospholipid acyltransferase (LPLAT)-like uncharacterized protein